VSDLTLPALETLSAVEAAGVSMVVLVFENRSVSLYGGGAISSMTWFLSVLAVVRMGSNKSNHDRRGAIQNICDDNELLWQP
jgi:hypothetical protein